MESFGFSVDGVSIQNKGGFDLPTTRRKDQVPYDKWASTTGTWGLSIENDVESILNQREGMLERMRLESEVARESAAIREARREVEELKKQDESLSFRRAWRRSLEVVTRPTQDQYEQQQHMIACLEDQVESLQAMLGLAASNSIDSLAGASLAEQQVKQLMYEAEAAQRQAFYEKQRVAEIEARLELMAQAHAKQIETMHRRSSALITNFIQPNKQQGRNSIRATGATSSSATSPSAEHEDGVAEAVNKLLGGLYSGEVPEEDVAKQLVALHCEQEQTSYAAHFV